MQDKTYGKRERYLKANALVHMLFNAIEEVEDKALGDTPNKVEAKAMVDMLA